MVAELEFTFTVINPARLDQELRAAFADAIVGVSTKPKGQGVVFVQADRLDDLRDGILAAIADHNPDDLTPEQQAAAAAEARVTAAAETARKIPGWAGWSEAEAMAYIQNNVNDLASAKVVLVAMARLLVALRDKTWPDLAG